MARSSSAAAASPSRRRAIDAALRRAQHLHAARRARRASVSNTLASSASLEQIRLVEDDEIGAGKLVLENFLKRIVVVDGLRLRALLRDGFEIVGETPSATARSVDDGDNAIHRQPASGSRASRRL